MSQLSFLKTQCNSAIFSHHPLVVVLTMIESVCVAWRNAMIQHEWCRYNGVWCQIVRELYPGVMSAMAKVGPGVQNFKELHVRRQDARRLFEQKMFEIDKQRQLLMDRMSNGIIEIPLRDCTELRDQFLFHIGIYHNNAGEEEVVYEVYANPVSCHLSWTPSEDWTYNLAVVSTSKTRDIERWNDDNLQSTLRTNGPTALKIRYEVMSTKTMGTFKWFDHLFAMEDMDGCYTPSISFETCYNQTQMFQFMKLSQFERMLYVSSAEELPETAMTWELKPTGGLPGGGFTLSTGLGPQDFACLLTRACRVA